MSALVTLHFTAPDMLCLLMLLLMCALHVGLFFSGRYSHPRTSATDGQPRQNQANDELGDTTRDHAGRFLLMLFSQT